VNNQFQ